MAVELIPNCSYAPCMGVANKTFYTMVNESGMSEIIGHQCTNDPIEVTHEDAIKCRDILKQWKPPEGWGSGLTNQRMKELFIEFFGRCNGFSTI